MADEDFPTELPSAYTWMTVRQLIGFVRHGGHLNVEARTLLALLGFLPATPAVPVGAAAHA
jgi:oxidase EvaA